MTGPEAYKESLRRLEESRTSIDRTGLLAEAGVLATLALAAATALGGGEGPPAPDWDAWYRTASEGPAAFAAEDQELAQAAGTEKS